MKAPAGDWKQSSGSDWKNASGRKDWKKTPSKEWNRPIREQKVPKQNPKPAQKKKDVVQTGQSGHPWLLGFLGTTIQKFAVPVLVGVGLYEIGRRFVFNQDDGWHSFDKDVQKQLYLASSRAIESRRMDRLFYDPIAAVITSRKALKLAEKESSLEQTEYCLRERFIDDFVRSTLKKSEEIKQVISIGCALNTRLFRIAISREDVKFYEVDKPNVVEYRKKILNKVSGALETKMKATELVGADVGVVGWDSELIVQGLDWNQKSLWIVDDPTELSESRFEVLFRTIGLLSTQDSIMVLGLSNCTEENFSTKVNLVTKCGYQVHGSTFVGEGKSGYGRWVGDPSNSCVLKISQVSKRPATVLSEGFSVFSEHSDAEEEPKFSALEFSAVGDKAEESHDFGGAEQSVVRLELQVSEPPSRSGNICIVGDHEHLGEWDPENAFPIGLAASEGTFIAELSFPLSVQSIEYKFVAVDGEDTVWENGPNRTLNLNRGSLLVVRNRWFD